MGRKAPSSKCSIGIVEALYAGRAGVVQAAELRLTSGHIERDENCLYPLELSCDWRASGTAGKLNPEVPVFRRLRTAAVVARPK